MAKKLEQSSVKGSFLPVVLTLGGFLLFLVLVGYIWIDRAPPTVARGGQTPEQRVETLRAQMEREQTALNGYGWVDQDQGIVRLPVERAMDLLVEEMNEGQNQP